MSTQQIQPMAFNGAVVRDDITGRPSNRLATIYREPDGRWRVDGMAFPAQANVIAAQPKVLTSRPWWTIVLAICLFPLGLLCLLVKNTRTVPVSFVELRAPDGRIVAFQIESDAAHLRMTLA